MTDEALEVWGKRWNSTSKGNVAFPPGAEELQAKVIELGIPALDNILGGGIPRGQISVFYGEPMAGKSLLSQLVVAAAQKAGGKAVFFDAEHTFDPKWAALTGVDISSEKLLVVRPESLEQAFDMMCDIIKTVQPEVLVVDSIPALVPQDILKADMVKQDFRGLHPRKIGVGLQKITQFNRSTAIILINQMRVEMGRTFGDPSKLPGGKALGHYNSIGVRVRRGKWLTDTIREDGELFGELADEKDAKRIGFLLKVRVEKSKRDAPWGECDIKAFFDGTIDPIGSLIHLAIQRGVIKVAGRGWFLLPNSEQKLHGLPAVEKTLKEDEEMKQKVATLVKEAK